MIRTAAAVALVVTLLASGPPACQPKDSPSGAPAAPAAPGAPNGGPPPAPGHKYACNITLHAPVVNWEMSGGPFVDGSTTADCLPPPPTEHVVTVFLDRYIGGKWVKQYGLDGSPGGVCHNIPGAGGPAECHWHIKPCVNGRWRVRAAVRWVGPPPDFRTGPEFDPPEAPEATLFCDKP